MEVQHPAAKLITMASKMQEDECGDGTNFVITLAGELLEQAESLIKMGLHPSLILAGYEEASKKCLEILDSLEAKKCADPRNLEEVKNLLKSPLSSKLTEKADFFSGLIGEACVRCLPENVSNFNIEHIRVNKIIGASLEDSFVMPGLIIVRNPETPAATIKKPRIAVYGVPLDTQNAETKGSILLKNAKELLEYTKGEEAIAENLVLGLKNANINFVVVGGTVSELIIHFLQKYDIGCLKITSKFELRRMSKALQATCLVRLGAPVEEEVGYCDEISVEEISSQKVTVFKKDTETCKLTTIVLRGSTMNLLDDVERAIDDAVNCYRCLIRDPRFVFGGSAVELVTNSKLISSNWQRNWKPKQT